MVDVRQGLTLLVLVLESLVIFCSFIVLLLVTCSHKNGRDQIFQLLAQLSNEGPSHTANFSGFVTR